ncbi:MAG: TrkA family potassium uptake protein [Actinomycetota bacterium]|nr:TrkA family potassium uptake protein [Actinomycetota bacterium]
MLGSKRDDDAVLVVGLGRFGGALAKSLERVGHEVLAVDESGELVQEWAGRLTHVVEADSTSEAAMRQVGAGDFEHAIIAIGTDIEASLLSASVLVDLGVRQVWAKAITPAHGKILQRIGVRHVVYPERDAGERIAHLISGRMIDFIEFDDGFAIVKIRAPREAHGQTLAESALRTKYGVTIVGVKRPGEDFTYAQADTVIHPGDLLIVAGKTGLVEHFAGQR